jgi:hypothetical protein
MDQATRELERRFSETGAPGDGAAWLRARLRAGELDPARLELAAFAGHRAAALVSGHDCQDERVCLRCYQELGVLRLLGERGGPAATLRAAIAAGRACLARWDAVYERGGWEALRREVERLRGGRGRAVPGTWDALRRSMARGLDLAARRARGEPEPRDAALRVALEELERRTPPGFDVDPLRLPLRAALQPERGPDWDCLQDLPREELLGAIGAEVAAWALGADPLRAPRPARDAPPGE